MPNLAARLRQRLGPVWGAAFVLFAAQRFGDAINAFIGIWLVPRYVPADELGAVLPLAQVATFVAMPLAVLLTPYAKLLNVHAERGEPGKVKAMFRDASLLALAVLLLTLAATPFFFPLVFRHFGIQNGNLALAIVVSATLGALAPIFTESLRALKRFGVVSLASAIAPPLRLAVMWIALPFRGLTGYFVGQTAGPAFQALAGNPYLFVVGAAAITLVLRFVIVSEMAYLNIVMVFLVPLCVGAGINPWVVGFAMYAVITPWFALYQSAVDSIPDANAVFERLNVNIRGAKLNGFGDDLVAQTDDRRVALAPRASLRFVAAGALDDGDRAGVAHREALAGPAGNEGISAGRAVQRHVADQGVFRLPYAVHRRAYGNRAAG